MESTHSSPRVLSQLIMASYMSRNLTGATTGPVPEPNRNSNEVSLSTSRAGGKGREGVYLMCFLVVLYRRSKMATWEKGYGEEEYCVV